ncbi:hypothetical protein BLNAU_2781 [Blattamonas nauphoetae]|uniref:Uncharacterized protein n=1 Tax=Blattamonas nauphoetae TaxID=2049346 RepID=A0ABQ9YEP1_9EUKA|nr:hypothetical protein BLNAU_2781 [Blattamonas nauphoetae]
MKTADLDNPHPHKTARKIFLAMNIVLLIVATVILVIFIFLAISRGFMDSASFTFFCIALAIFVLSPLGIVGARYGPKGKEPFLIFLLIYYFTFFTILGVFVIFSLFYNFGDNPVTTAIQGYVMAFEASIRLWISSAGILSSFLSIIFQTPLLAGILLAVFLSLIIFSMGLAVYLMGYRPFLKANIIFGSAIIFIAGIVLSVFSVQFGDDLDFGGSLSFLDVILTVVGVVVCVAAVAGTICGIFIVKCFMGLHIYFVVLVVLMGLLIVIGLVVIVFPGIFWVMLAESLTEGCTDLTGSEYSKVCEKEMKALFHSSCNSTQDLIDKYNQTYPARGECSLADIRNKVVNSHIESLLDVVDMIGIGALGIAVVLLYVSVILLISLNSNWEARRPLKINPKTVRRRVHRD